jgi:hypothetical protein
MTRPQLHEVTSANWVKNPVDAFILDAMTKEGLKPASRASRRALLRRAYYDLTGLPPTLEQTDRFLADDSPEAFERLVNELLASDHYGERWGRHWLDCVRYAESNSFERDNPKPMVWRYRDYVIQSFNQDKPYDQFIREQLAGDELDTVTPESLTATGYYRLGIWDDEPTDRVQARYDVLDDILATTSQVFMGMTMNCARCHDHKLDPIPQKDYYKFLAFFHNVRPNLSNKDHILTDIPTAQERAEREGTIQANRQKTQALEKAIQGFESRVLVAAQGEDSIEETDPKRRAELLESYLEQTLNPEEINAYNKARESLAQLKAVKLPPWPQALIISEEGRKAPDTFVLLRGSAHNKGERVEPGFPSCLEFPDPVIPEAPEGASSSGRRRILADWLASPENPLSARVMINRIWQHHFGRGLVTSPNNFGLAGDLPTHPELLDWLATEFIQRGWSIKAMHRLLMNSSTYQMAAEGQPESQRRDEDNRLYSRHSMRRLTAEELRDSILKVNGTLNPKMGGPSIYPTLPREVLATQSRPGANWGKSSPEEEARRSVYIHIKRSLLVPLLTAFDLADPDTTCPVRFTTTQPTQALTMLNSAFIQKQASLFAARLRKEAGSDEEAQVTLALRLALSRSPSSADMDRGLTLMRELQAEEGLSKEQALNQFCLAVLNLNEFVYLD